MLLPLAFMREIVDLLSELAAAADHIRERGCCRVHRLHDAIAFRVRLRERLDEWKDEQADKEERWARGERAKPLFPVKRKPELPPARATGSVRVPLARAARRGRR